MPVEIDTIKEGNGQKPVSGQQIECHYVLSLQNGTKVDSSRDRGKTFKFCLGKGEVIKGWEEGIARVSHRLLCAQNPFADVQGRALQADHLVRHGLRRARHPRHDPRQRHARL